jgi:hypothetical protein
MILLQTSFFSPDNFFKNTISISPFLLCVLTLVAVLALIIAIHYSLVAKKAKKQIIEARAVSKDALTLSLIAQNLPSELVLKEIEKGRIPDLDIIAKSMQEEKEKPKP